MSAGLADAARLGLGEAVAVSAETGEGMADLYEALQPHIDAHTQAMNAAADADAVGSGPAGALGGMEDSTAAEAEAADMLQQSDGDFETAAIQLNQQQQAWLSQTLPQPGPASGQEDRPPTQADGHRQQTPPLRIAIMGLPNVVMEMSAESSTGCLTCCVADCTAVLPAHTTWGASQCFALLTSLKSPRRCPGTDDGPHFLTDQALLW